MSGGGIPGRRPRVRRRRAAPGAILGSFALLLVGFGAATVWYGGPSRGGGAPDGAGAAADARKTSPPRTGRSLLASVADADLPTVVRAGGTTYGDLCEPADTFLKRPAALALYVPGVLFTFLGLAIVTDEYFVPALERICDALRLSDDVAGATFAAAGSSAPELFTSLLAVFVTKDEVGVGTIVGSAVFNVLVIIGVSAMLAGSVLELDWRPLVRDSAFYALFISVLLVQVLGVTKGEADWWEGLIMLGIYACYILFMAFANKPYMRVMERFLSASKKAALAAEREVKTLDVESQGVGGTTGESQPAIGVANGAAAVGPSSIDAQADRRTPAPADGLRRVRTISVTRSMSGANGKLRGTWSSRSADTAPGVPVVFAAGVVAGADDLPSGDGGAGAAPEETFLGIALPTTRAGWAIFPFSLPWLLAFKLTIIDCAQDKYAKWWAVTFGVSVAWIAGISYLMVEAARFFGCIVGIPAAVLGVTVLAAGTSVPDALASISVARAGKGDFAVCNALGSNCFDVGIGLGAPWFLGGLILKGPQIIPTEPITAIVVPVIILFGILTALLGLLAATKWKLGKGIGGVLIGGYGLFVAYSLLDVYVFNPAS